MRSPPRPSLIPLLPRFLAMMCLAALLHAAERPTAAPLSLDDALTGVWVHVGEPGEVRPPPKTGGRFKFRIDGRWVFTSADPRTGEVRAHFGGTYRVEGNRYFETIDYSTDPDDPELKRTLQFTVKIEGDRMTQHGVGNPYTEVWQRVRKPPGE